jgi:Carboxylesterase family
MARCVGNAKTASPSSSEFRTPRRRSASCGSRLRSGSGPGPASATRRTSPTRPSRLRAARWAQGNGRVPAPSEDCLYLNVWTPAADCKRRPVMFYNHGGGYMIGSGSATGQASQAVVPAVRASPFAQPGSEAAVGKGARRLLHSSRSSGLDLRSRSSSGPGVSRSARSRRERERAERPSRGCVGGARRRGRFPSWAVHRADVSSTSACSARSVAVP